MKNLLMKAIIFLTAIFNNIPFTISDKQIPYAHNNYFYIDEYEAPDYRVLYDRDFIVESNTTSCKTSNYNGGGVYCNYDDVKGFNGVKGYWFIPGVHEVISEKPTTSDIDSKLIQYSDTKGFGSYIICPFDAKLLSSSKTNNGTNMELLITVTSTDSNEPMDFYISINNMNRWYCCMDRLNYLKDAEGNITWQHTSPEQQGHIFKSGNVLGKATANTTISIKLYNDDDTPVTFRNLFLQQTP